MKMQVTKNYDDVKKPKTVFSKLSNKIHDVFGFKTEIKWFNFFLILFYHIIGAVWCYYYAFPAKWQTVVFAIYMFYFAGLGVSIGAHRYWTHHAFKATFPLELLMVIMFASAGQNSIVNWVRDHRVHHKNSDTMGDPHNARRGFFYSHIGWLMMKKHPDVIKTGKQVNLDDMYSDPLVMWQERNFGKLKLLCCYILPTLIQILWWNEKWQTAVAWQCFIRYLVSAHVEFTVNSVAHMFGTRPYKKDIEPRESWLANLVTTGDGNHNYHHSFPYDYRNTENLNITHILTGVIKLWEMLGLAYDLRVATPATVESCAKKMGDGTRKSDTKTKNGATWIEEEIFFHSGLEKN